jgi:hypothetical protein
MSKSNLIVGKELKSLKQSLKTDSYSEALKLEIIGELIRTMEHLEKQLIKTITKPYQTKGG